MKTIKLLMYFATISILIITISCSKSNYLLIEDGIGDVLLKLQYKDAKKINTLAITDITMIAETIKKHKYEKYLLYPTLAAYYCQIKELNNIDITVLSEATYEGKCDDGSKIKSLTVDYTEAIKSLLLILTTNVLNDGVKDTQKNESKDLESKSEDKSNKVIFVLDANSKYLDLIDRELIESGVFKIVLDNQDNHALTPYILDLVEKENYKTLVILNQNRNEIIKKSLTVDNKISIIALNLGVIATKLDNVHYDIGYDMEDVKKYLDNGATIIAKLKPLKKSIFSKEDNAKKERKNQYK